MLAHSLRDWPSIKPALVQRLVFCWAAGVAVHTPANTDIETLAQCIVLVGGILLAASTSRNRPNVKCWASVAGAGHTLDCI